jgi:short-subunit dehydrogenase
MDYVFISGAAGFIGGSFAREFAARKRALFLVGRNRDKLTAAAAELSARHGVAVETFACDFTDETARAAMYAYAEDKGMRFSHIVNVAGIDDQGPFSEFTARQIRDMIRVNVEGTIEVTAALMRLRAETGVKIITVSSLAACFRMPLMALYSASKRMLCHFFLALRRETRGTGVEITVVLPGAVPTRGDVRERIRAQGLAGKLSSVDPDVLARRSIAMSERGRAVYVPGAFNRFLRALGCLVPEFLTGRAVMRRWRKSLSRQGQPAPNGENPDSNKRGGGAFHTAVNDCTEDSRSPTLLSRKDIL